MANQPVLEVKKLNTFYSTGGVLGKKTVQQVLRDVSFTVNRGEIVALVGESGAGKSTLAKAILGMLDQYEGEIVIVPFAYEFTAYEREKVAVEAGTFVRDEYAYDATANPYYHMNFDDVTEDLYEGGNWVEASAEISNDSLVFTFCFYGCYLDGDYTRVVATYTPNN